MDKPRFALLRILGNELPPRDRPGSRLEALAFILENEPRFPGCRRLWLLNHVHDPLYAQKLKRLLKLHGEEFHELAFDIDRYLSCWSLESKIRYAVNINAARNEALRLGRGLAEFCFVLDGDCFLRREDFERIAAEIGEDQRLRPDRRYYSLPMVRASAEEVLSKKVDMRYLEEPQLVFRRDAELRFDESLAFGNKDKVELLTRLGHAAYAPGRAQEHALSDDGLCRSVGSVLHLHTGGLLAEDSRWERGRQREHSLRVMVEALNRRAASSPRLGHRLNLWLHRALHGSVAEGEAEERYHADLRSFRVGADLEVAYARPEEARLVPTPLVNALLRCRQFRTIPEHAEAACSRLSHGDKARLSSAVDRFLQDRGLPPGPKGPLLPRLERAFSVLSRDGLLPSLSSILALCRQADSREHPKPIACLGLVARGSDEALEACLASYAENARRHGRAEEIVILDESASPEAEPRRRELLRALQARLELRLLYAGREEREAFARALEGAGAHGGAADLALLGRPGSGASARNALLLHSPGERVLCADDSTLCRAGPDLGGAADPLSLPEKVLGWSLGHCLTDIHQITPEVLRMLRSDSKVAVAFEDGKEPREGERRTRDRAALERQLRLSGFGLKESPLVENASVTDGLLCPGPLLGMDGAQALAPFPPVAGGAALAAAIAQRAAGALCVRLPWRMAGSACGPFPSDALQRSGLLAYDLLAHSLLAWDEAASLPPGPYRLRALGEYWSSLGSLPSREFGQALQEQLWRGLGRYAAAYGRLRRGCDDWPHFKREETAEQLDGLRRELPREDYLAPCDLDPDPERALRLARALFADMGRLVSRWPDLLAAAARLRGQGTRLARAL